MPDRTTKLILGAIAIALWLLVMRSLFSPGPLLASSSTPSVSAFIWNGFAYYFVAKGDRLYLYELDGTSRAQLRGSQRLEKVGESAVSLDQGR